MFMTPASASQRRPIDRDSRKKYHRFGDAPSRRWLGRPLTALSMSSKRINSSIRRKAAGAWLREQRTRCGLTQHGLAEAVGIMNYTMISQIEGGKATIQSKDYQIWSAALDMDLYDFTVYCTFFYHFYEFKALFGEDQPDKVIKTYKLK